MINKIINWLVFQYVKWKVVKTKKQIQSGKATKFTYSKEKGFEKQ